MRSSKISSKKIPFNKDNLGVITSSDSGKDTLREKAEAEGKLLEIQESRPISESIRKTKAHITLSDTEAQRLIYELEVHQLELEMQNKELLQAKNNWKFRLKNMLNYTTFHPQDILP